MLDLFPSTEHKVIGTMATEVGDAAGPGESHLLLRSSLLSWILSISFFLKQHVEGW